MSAEENDPLCARPACGDHAADPHGAVTDDGGRLAAAHASRNRRVVIKVMNPEALPHDVKVEHR